MLRQLHAQSRIRPNKVLQMEALMHSTVPMWQRYVSDLVRMENRDNSGNICHQTKLSLVCHKVETIREPLYFGRHVHNP